MKFNQKVRATQNLIKDKLPEDIEKNANKVKNEVHEMILMG